MFSDSNLVVSCCNVAIFCCLTVSCYDFLVSCCNVAVLCSNLVE